MTEKGKIIFKCEGNLFRALADGTKTWDARRYDLEDSRIYRLACGSFSPAPAGRKPDYQPGETFCHFVNKQTGELLQFRYRGMEFVPWAPGWCFLQLGGLVSHGIPPEESELSESPGE